MAEVASAFISLIPSARGFGSKLSQEIDGPADRAGRQAGDKAGKGFGAKFTGGLKGLMAPLAGILAGAGVVSFFGDAIRGASDLQQSAGGVQAVFKDNAAAVTEFATGAAKDLGLSQNAYNGLAAIIGTTLKASGTSMDQLAGSTDTMIGRAADLSATFGGTVVDASNAMASALRGEFEPLRAYGVSLDQASINARALADSGKASVSELTLQEKAVAAQALIFEKSADAQGQFASESDTLAGKQERLRAQFDNVKASVGERLLPAMSGLVGFLSGTALPAFESFVSWITGSLVPGIAAFAAKVNEWKVPILAVVGVITAVFLPHLIALGVAHTVTAAKAVAAWVTTQAGAVRAAVVHSGAVIKMVAGWVLMGVQSLIQAARMAAAWLIAMGPVGWVIAAVIGLAALIIANWDTIVAWTKQAWTNVTAWLSKAWQNIKTTASNVWAGIVAFFKGIPGKLTQVFLNFTLIGLLIKHWATIKTGAVNGWNAVVDWVKGIPGKIVSALGNLGSILYNAGSRIIQGFLDGLRAGFDAVKSFVGGIGSWIADNKGPKAYDLRLLQPAGGWIMQGLQTGIRGEIPALRTTLDQVSSSIAVRSNLNGLGAGGTNAGGLGGGVIELGPRSISALGSEMLRGSRSVVADKTRAVRLAGR